jgi:hypothetical protein
LPPTAEADIRAQLNRTGQMLLARAQSRAPVYQGPTRKGTVAGALRAGLSYRVPPKRLSLRVGLVGKPINRKLFYGRLVEFGHRIGFSGNRLPKLERVTGHLVGARLIRARRRRDVRVDGVPPHPFLYTVTRAEIYQPFSKMWGRALQAAKNGVSDD